MSDTTNTSTAGAAAATPEQVKALRSSWASTSLSQALGDAGVAAAVIRENETQIAMENLCKLVSLMGKGDSEVPQGFKAAFDAVFDKSVQAQIAPIDTIFGCASTTTTTTGQEQQQQQQQPALKEMNYDELYKEYCRCIQEGYLCELIHCKPFMKGVIEYTMRATAGSERVTIRSTAMILGGKLVIVERKDTQRQDLDENKKSCIIMEAGGDVPASVARRANWAFGSVSNVGDAEGDITGLSSSTAYHEDPVLKQAMENITALVHLQAGSGSSGEGGDEDEKVAPPAEFEQAFDKVFDPKVHAKVKPLDQFPSDSNPTGEDAAAAVAAVKFFEMDYEALKKDFENSFALGYEAQVVRIKPHMHGVVEYTIFMRRKQNDLTVRTSVLIQNGKVTNVDQLDVVYTPKEVIEPVSGQKKVAAADENTPVLEGFKTERELASKVLAVSGKLLAGSSSGIKPCMEAGNVVKLYMTRSKTMFQFEGHWTITTDAEGKKPYCDGVHFKEYKRRLVTGTSFVLCDRDDNALAMCFQELVMIDRRAFDLYGLRPLWTGDHHFDYENGELCYPWFRLEEDKESDHYRSIRVWTGAGYRSMWRAYTYKKPPTDKDKKKKEDADEKGNDNKDKDGKKKKEEKRLHPIHKGEIIFRTGSGDSDLAYVKKTTDDKTKKVQYEMTIAPGVDPAVVVCVTAVLEIMVGIFQKK